MCGVIMLSANTCLTCKIDYEVTLGFGRFPLGFAEKQIGRSKSEHYTNHYGKEPLGLHRETAWRHSLRDYPGIENKVVMVQEDQAAGLGHTVNTRVSIHIRRVLKSLLNIL